MTSVFSEQILAGKLSELNSTQQCIESLSSWCVSHQSKAEIVVKTWEKQFQSSEVVQKVSLIYLANDIIQNSRKIGNEFVSEFWKVIPGALKDLVEKGNDHGKKVVNRLVDIWEERKVFGSHAKNIKDVLLGVDSPQPLDFTKKRPRSVKIVKRDSRSVRTTLTIGSRAERIVSAFHLVVSEHPGEDEETNKCKSAIHRVKKLEKDIDLALTNANDPKRKTLSKELEEEENLIKQCIEKLKVVEANRLALVSQLRDALNDQESELENVRNQMQVAQAQTQESEMMRKRLEDVNYVADLKQTTAPPPSTATTPPPVAGGSKKSAADIVADRLAASTSSQYIMSSVLSSFAAELTNTNSVSQPEPPPPADHNHFMPPQMAANTPYQTVLIPSQPQYHTQQYLQPSSGVVTSYAYSGGPPPPPPSYMMSPMVPMQMTHQPPMPPQQSPPPANFRPVPPFYAHPHQSQ